MKHLHLAIGSLLLGVAFQTAADPVVIINPKQDQKLSVTDIRNLYLGNTKSFPNGSPAVPVALKSGKVRETFLSTVLNKTDSQYKAFWSRLVFTGVGQPPKEVESEDELKRLVANNPNIVGYIDSSKLDTTVHDAAK